MHDAEHWLKILGLGPEATEQQIGETYRELVKVWNPDRFESDPQLRRNAEEKLHELNRAFEHLRGDTPRSGGVHGSRTAPRSHQPSGPSNASRSPAVTNAWTFAGVSAATAAVVGAMLYFAIPRATAPQDDADALNFAPDVPPVRSLRPKVETPAPEPPAPAAPTTGMLTVVSQPSGAMVFFDDHGVGQTPLTLMALVPGAHRIRLELSGHPAWTSPVQVEPGGGEKLLAILEARQAAN